MVSVRRVLAIVGAAAIIGGLVVLVLPVALDSTVVGHRINCGSAIVGYPNDAYSVDRSAEQFTPYGPHTDYVADCRAKVHSRRVWAIPAAVLGGIVGVGALIVRPPRREPTG
jgi:hypothetical protein